MLVVGTKFIFTLPHSCNENKLIISSFNSQVLYCIFQSILEREEFCNGFYFEITINYLPVLFLILVQHPNSVILTGTVITLFASLSQTFRIPCFKSLQLSMFSYFPLCSIRMTNGQEISIRQQIFFSLSIRTKSGLWDSKYVTFSIGISRRIFNLL